MRSFTKHLTPVRLALATAVFLAAGGGAWAATKGTAHTIHGCYAKHGGSLRLATHCRHGEKSIAWNQTGAAGPAGAPGDAGAAGPRGLEGPSDLYATGTAFEELSSTKYFQAGLLALPPGSYLLQSKATFFQTSAATAMLCALDLEQGGTKTLLDEATSVANTNVGAGGVNSTIGTVTLAAEAHVELLCKLQGGTEGSIDDARLIALKVGAVHGTLPID